MNLAETTVALARKGISVFPLIPRRKVPAFDWMEFKTRAADPARVAYWWQQWPDCNIGLATGAVSGLFVLDCDSVSAIRLVESHGVPPTVGAVTAQGLHYYFKKPDFAVGNRAGIMPGVDIRGTGGYVVAPPSIHPSGVRYSWQYAREIAPAPGWLLDMLRPRPVAPSRPIAVPRDTSSYGRAALDSELDRLSEAVKGERNSALNRSAYKLGQLVGGGRLTRGEVERGLFATALYLGLTETETRKTIASGMSAGIANPR